MSRLPTNRPVRIAPDLNATVFEDVDINLHDLHAAANGARPGITQGRTFRGCRIQGPAVMLVSAGVSFDGCNFGATEGGMTDVVLRPTGARALGTVPMRDCVFEDCQFYNVGFTGPEDVIEMLLAVGKGA